MRSLTEHEEQLLKEFRQAREIEVFHKTVWKESRQRRRKLWGRYIGSTADMRGAG